MFNQQQNLASILGTFTKVKSDLTSFLTTNREKAAKLTAELKDVSADNVKAEEVLANLNSLLGDQPQKEN